PAMSSSLPYTTLFRSIEHARRSEPRVALEQGVDGHPRAVPGPEPPHRHARSLDVGAAAEQAAVAAHVGMRHEDARQRRKLCRGRSEEHTSELQSREKL